MSLQTIEVELDHGRVIPKWGEQLPESGAALLTLLSPRTAAIQSGLDPLTPNPLLQNIVFRKDPTLPLDAEDWPDA